MVKKPFYSGVVGMVMNPSIGGFKQPPMNHGRGPTPRKNVAGLFPRNRHQLSPLRQRLYGILRPGPYVTWLMGARCASTRENFDHGCVILRLYTASLTIIEESVQEQKQTGEFVDGSKSELFYQDIIHFI